MTPRLAEKVAVVTGSGQNIGRAIAIALAEEGAKVVTNSRSPRNPQGTAEDTAKVVRNAGGEATAVFSDVSTMEGGRRLIEDALDVYGAVDILVNNAGYGASASIMEMSEAQWDEMMDLHLKGHFSTTRLAVPVMREQGSGRIINISSRAAIVGPPGVCAYAAAKAGVMGFTWGLAQELGAHGITVNCIMPTATGFQTPTVRQLMEQQGTTASDQPERLPEDVAPLAVFLATDAAAGVNGQLFHASGGRFTLYSRPEPVDYISRNEPWSLQELEAAFSATLSGKLSTPPPAFLSY